MPVAACLCPDDAWRDFVISNPGLAELRRQIRSYPGADLRAAALEMAAAGRISKEDALLL